jgi:RNA polymerase sigma factor (sigma-70 family)
MPTDVELLDAWIAGDDRAAEALIQRYFDPLYAFFRNKVNADVDDLIQSTFQACVTYRERFRQAASFRAYLFTAARHQLYAHLDKRHRQRGAIDPAVVSVRELDPSPSGMVAQHQEQRLLLEALRRIPLQYQMVLELHYWQDLSTAEAAEVLNIPQGTVKTRLRKGRELLESAMQEIGASGEVLETTMMNLERWAASLRPGAE